MSRSSNAKSASVVTEMKPQNGAASRSDIASGSAKESTKPRKKARRKKKASKRPTSSVPAASSKGKGSRKRGPKPYPVMTFEQAMEIGQGILEHAAGKAIKRVTLLEMMKLEPGSARARNLITNSSKYGITIGNHSADQLKLTDAGRRAIAKADSADRLRARFELAIRGVEPWQRLYETYKGGRLPALQVMQDVLEEINAADRRQVVELFVDNAKTVGLLRTIDGAENLLSLDDALGATASAGGMSSHAASFDGGGDSDSDDVEDYEKVCFYIAPIGEEGSETRKHSDALLASFVEPALAESGFRVVRADRITKPGMISKQIIEYVLRSGLVIADLSFHNPNVFYELCLRHVTGRPTVHLIRKEDQVPFDTGNFRTVVLDTADKYTLLAKIEVYRAEIANAIREAIGNGVTNDNPILSFSPSIRVAVDAKLTA